MNDIDDLIASLARVEPGRPGADPSGAGARTLLAQITVRKPANRTRRIGLALAGAAAAAGVVLLQAGSPSYAVTKDADGVVWIKIHDFGDVSGLRADLAGLGVSAMVDSVPAGHWCREPRGETILDPAPGLYSLPQDGPVFTMRIDGNLLEPDQTIVFTVGAGGSVSTLVYRGPVAPCELVPRPPFDGEMTDEPFRFADVPGIEGRTVGEVLPGLREEAVEFMVIDIPPGNPGGWGTGPIRKKVDHDWHVWGAVRFSGDPGTLVLLVTEENLGRNPVTGD
ncbi:hypothetical protein GT755_10055 [Herbidospora sp. NEAU-GS84]|uniref:Uncharacterized protein n=1 Tax=Herbidospora solisilvae TaxID=2696284 RepID=A0A7C9J1Q1_9ACTN|nr:hypothetical protein [Herbidospora solisilvae]NAS22026.1 hypothetical protein [Herbidospora solisilvae]